MISFKSIDYELLIPTAILIGFGLITNYPANGFDVSSLFFKQLIFSILFFVIIFIFANINYDYLKGHFVSIVLFLGTLFVLISLLLFAPEINEARSWIILGSFSIQPVDFAKIVLIIVLARYFAVRHVFAKHLRHLIVSLVFALTFFILTFLQPDFGSSLIFLGIWLGMIFVSGISKKYMTFLFIIFLFFSFIGWSFFLTEYQKDRLISFINPVENIQSEGYNSYQSKIAVGSGGLFGRGIGEGTQSKLSFLPLYETDFVFAAFAEEWGLTGVLILFSTFLILISKLFHIAWNSRGNFEILYIIGVISYFVSHFFIHIGVNIGFLPVTGITLPFLSYGGSHLIAEAIMLGIVMSIAKKSCGVLVGEVKIDRT